MKLLVCGGRRYTDAAGARCALDAMAEIGPIEMIITGGARGADRLAEDYAVERGIPVRIFRAEWHRLGRAAGPVRNQVMLDEAAPDLVLALPGGAGTDDMVRRAKKAGVRVVTAWPGRRSLILFGPSVPPSPAEPDGAIMDGDVAASAQSSATER